MPSSYIKNFKNSAKIDYIFAVKGFVNQSNAFFKPYRNIEDHGSAVVAPFVYIANSVIGIMKLVYGLGVLITGLINDVPDNVLSSVAESLALQAASFIFYILNTAISLASFVIRTAATIANGGYPSAAQLVVSDISDIWLAVAPRDDQAREAFSSLYAAMR